MKLSSKLVVIFLLALCAATNAFAQFHPFPASDTEAPAICTDCQGVNSSGQANDGLPTYPYSTPLTEFVGRFVDSSSTRDFQNVGMRTARAQRLLLAPVQRGSAPPRLYVQMGSTLAAYSLDTFFSNRLAEPMRKVSAINTGWKFDNHNPQETICAPDAWVYAEAKNSGWQTIYMDGQDRLGFSDYDDRGYVYVGYSLFGWGIVKDSGETGITKLPVISQVTTSSVSTQTNITPWMVLSIKTGGKYYVITTDHFAAETPYAGHDIYDVTNPASPTFKRHIDGQENGYKSWAKDDENERIAVTNGLGELRIFSYSEFVTGGQPIVTFAKDTVSTSDGYIGVVSDGDGNFYAIQSENKIVNATITKIVKSGNSYRTDTLTPFTAEFQPEHIHYADKYLTVTGREKTDSGKNSFALYVFRTTTTSLDLIDTKDFFQRYYHTAPSGYAEPYKEATLQDALTMKWGNKTYLLYSADKLGDVYELQAGDTVTASLKTSSYGTANPNAEGGSGPYYGDILTFKSVGSNPTWTYNVQWNFGNPENGTENTKTSQTGKEVAYQYNNLNTSAKISAQKAVSVVVTNDDSISDDLKVNLAVPAPRVGVQGNSAILATANAASFDVVAGDQFVDASDGVVEGHYGVWTIGTTSTTIKPNQTVDVGSVGPHSLDFTAKYGKYDATALTSIGTPYQTSLSNIQYVVRPFDISLKAPTKGTASYTFSGNARVSTVDGMVTAQNWTVTWTLKDPSGGDIVPPQVDTKPVGQLTTFLVPVATLIPSRSKVALEVSVLPSEVNATSEYATDKAEMDLVTPDPILTAPAGCNTGSPCTLTVTKQSGGAIPAEWLFKWTVKNGTSPVSLPSSTTNPLTFTPSAPGNYSATVAVTQGIFTEEKTKSISVAGPICGPPPTADQVAIAANCSSCETNTPIEFMASLWHYEDQDCNTYSWSFGDGGTATGFRVTHTFTAKRTYTVTLTVKTTGGAQTSITKSLAVGSGSVPDPDPVTCTKPSGLILTYKASNANCKPGGSCTTADSIKFTVTRGDGTVQTCDAMSWTFDDGATSTSKAPSHTFTSPNTYDVAVTVTNEKGSAQATARVTVTKAPTGGNCGALENVLIYVEYSGPTSHCSVNTGACGPGEAIQFHARGWQYDFQSCDKFEWDFDDGTAKDSSQDPVHTFAGSKSSYNVKLRVYNTSNTTGVSETQVVPMGVPDKPVPVLTFGTTFPKTGAKDREITFTATSNLDQTTGWKWTFNSVADNTQTSVVSKTNTIKHTFTQVGTYTVKVTARNAEAGTTAPTGSVQDTISITDEPEAVYLLPVVAHIGGQNNSSWRTDLQIYNPDPNASESNPLIMSASFNGAEKNLYVLTSTYIRPDFMSFFTNGNASGPVLMRTKAKYPPQIWTRTYNQTENGTYGQFIPAIRIDTNGGGSATLDGKYYLAGLRQDSDFRTNLGFVNPTSAQITATITAYDDHRVRLGQISQPIGAYQLVQFPISQIPGVSAAVGPMSVVVEIPSGQWIIAYASLIDGKSSDPVFMQAVRETDLASADYQNNVIPGVGHVTQSDGSWRSDVTIFNPSSEGVQLTLEYYNSGGTKLAEGSVLIDPLKFIQYSDLLKQGVLGNVADGLGVLRVKVPGTLDRYPMTFARTYFDRGSIGTFGQGIGGFSAARPNVQPGKKALIPGVRDNAEYYTNIGLANIGDVPATVVVTLLDPNTGAPSDKRGVYTLQPNQSVVGRFEMNPFEAGTLIVETNAGKVWAFASCIDKRTKDPEYVPAISLP